MKEMVKIRYQSVICHGTQKIKDDVEALAEHTWQNGVESWRFDHPTHGQMCLELQPEVVILTAGISKLQMRYLKREAVSYATMYGQLSLVVHLRKYQRELHRLRLVYDLYDGMQLISKAYILLDVINPS